MLNWLPQDSPATFFTNSMSATLYPMTTVSPLLAIVVYLFLFLCLCLHSLSCRVQVVAMLNFANRINVHFKLYILLNPPMVCPNSVHDNVFRITTVDINTGLEWWWTASWTQLPLSGQGTGTENICFCIKDASCFNNCTERMTKEQSSTQCILSTTTKILLKAIGCFFFLLLLLFFF